MVNQVNRNLNLEKEERFSEVEQMILSADQEKMDVLKKELDGLLQEIYLRANPLLRNNLVQRIGFRTRQMVMSIFGNGGSIYKRTAEEASSNPKFYVSERKGSASLGPNQALSALSKELNELNELMAVEIDDLNQYQEVLEKLLPLLRKLRNVVSGKTRGKIRVRENQGANEMPSVKALLSEMIAKYEKQSSLKISKENFEENSLLKDLPPNAAKLKSILHSLSYENVSVQEKVVLVNVALEIANKNFVNYGEKARLVLDKLIDLSDEYSSELSIQNRLDKKRSSLLKLSEKDKYSVFLALVHNGIIRASKSYSIGVKADQLVDRIRSLRKKVESLEDEREAPNLRFRLKTLEEELDGAIAKYVDKGKSFQNKLNNYLTEGFNSFEDFDIELKEALKEGRADAEVRGILLEGVRLANTKQQKKLLLRLLKSRKVKAILSRLPENPILNGFSVETQDEEQEIEFLVKNRSNAIRKKITSALR